MNGDIVNEEIVCDALFSVYDRDFIKELVSKDKKVAENLGDTLNSCIEAYEKKIEMYAENDELTKELLEEVEELKKINELFKEELKVAVKKSMSDKSDVKSGKEKHSVKDNVDFLHKMTYNQYRSEKLAFEHGNAPTGTQRILFNTKSNRFEVWEKGDDALLIMGVAKYGKEAEQLYERVYGEKTLGFYGDIERFESPEVQDIWNSKLSENGANGKRDSGEIERERREYNAGRSGADLSESNNEKSLNEPSSEDGGFSMPKFSVKDKQYLALAENPEQNKAELQKMVDEAAKAAGFNKKAYHGTDERFTVFDSAFAQEGRLGRAFYFANSKDYARRYGGRIIEAYIKSNNPLDETSARVLSQDEMTETGKLVTGNPNYVHKGGTPKLIDMFSRMKNSPSRKIFKVLEKLGYDSVKTNDGITIVFDPEQIKSADPVTYDDNSNIIPLSERFNSENNDIRYSIKDYGSKISSKYFDSDAQNLLDGISEENNIKNFMPSGVSKEFINAVKHHGNFMRPRLYRGIDADEFNFILENGYIKSNSSMNFENQQGQTLFSHDIKYAYPYATSFAPKKQSEDFYEKGKPSYIVEIANSPEINIRTNVELGNEQFTYDEIPNEYITRVIELRYNKETKKVSAKDVTAENGFASNFENIGYVHGAADFVKDGTTGTVLYNVQDEYGWGTDKYISAADPDFIIDFGEDGNMSSEINKKYLSKLAKISGDYSDLHPIENDIRYSVKGNGYDGYSMSNNARTAYLNGEMPLSKWSKSVIVEAVSEMNPDIDISRLNLETLKSKFLEKTSWHHTSGFYNKTDFYSIRSNISSMTQEDIDSIENIHAKKETRDTSHYQSVDDVFSKIQVMKAAGVLKTDNFAVKLLSDRSKFDGAYQRAVSILKTETAKKVEQWKNLPENHYRHNDIKKFNENSEEYIKSTYGGEKPSRNSNLFKRIESVVAENQISNDTMLSKKSIPSEIEAYYNSKIAENRELTMILNNLGEEYSSMSGKVVPDDVQIRKMANEIYKAKTKIPCRIALTGDLIMQICDNSKATVNKKNVYGKNFVIILLSKKLFELPKSLINNDFCDSIYYSHSSENNRLVA